MIKVKLIKDSNLINEVSKKSYSKIKKDMRIHMTAKDKINLPFAVEQEPSFKPRGLWYGIGTSWIEWVRSEMPEWEGDYIFNLDIDPTKILQIKSSEELLKFSKEYANNMNGSQLGIDWSEVAKQYSGIEISPYQYSMRFDSRTRWYYGWDIPSGCIWNSDAIKGYNVL